MFNNLNFDKMLTQERIKTNFIAYTKRLEKYNCYSKEMINDIGDKLMNCSYALNQDSGAAYDGSMIDIVLNKLCKIAYDINEKAFGGEEKVAHPQLCVNTNMLMRVLLLQHIGKAEMFVTQPEQWKFNKGFLFDFNRELPTALKLGERSIFMCQKYGIKLSEEEYDAMRSIDRDDDSSINMYTTPLAAIVKMANQLVAIECRREYQSKNKKETIEN